MPKHLQRELETLKKKLLRFGVKTEEAVRDSVLSIDKLDANLASAVIDGDIEMDNMEIEIEEDCLKILALHQPVAIDLRFIVAVLKINSDLERIGDLAVNIAERAVFISTQQPLDVSLHISDMGKKAQLMLRQSLDALVNLDSALAHQVCRSDDAVDALNKKMYLTVQDEILKRPEQIQSLIHLLSASRHLERIADHATNIAEDVIYMIEGQIVRHRTEEYK